MKKFLYWMLISLMVLALSVVSLYWYVNFTSRELNIDIEYYIKYEQIEDNPNNDYLYYSIIITNEGSRKLVNFDVDILFEKEMSKYIPSATFVTEPINLFPPDSQSSRNKIEYSRKALIVKPGLLSESDLNQLNDIFSNLVLKVSWIGGEKQFNLGKEDLKSGSTTKL